MVTVVWCSWQFSTDTSKKVGFTRSTSGRRQGSGERDSGLCAGELSGEDMFSNCSGVLQRLAVRDGMGENKSPYAYRDSSSPGREELGVVCRGLRESVLVELGRAWGNGDGLDTMAEFSSRMYFVFHFF